MVWALGIFDGLLRTQDYLGGLVGCSQVLRGSLCGKRAGQRQCEIRRAHTGG
jgi:hypothetical protein